MQRRAFLKAAAGERPRTYNFWEPRMPEGRGTVLTHEEMTATNTFDDPDDVTLSELSVQIRGDAAHVTIPPKAVVALELRIA